MEKKPYQLFLANNLFLNGRYDEARAEYERGVNEAHDPLAALNLGQMYHLGISVKPDYKKAYDYYFAASSLDGGIAGFNLALFHLRGLGVPVDFKQAYEQMCRSADLGCVDAKLYLGLAHLLGCIYDPADIACISNIPFYNVVRRDPAMLLEGAEPPSPELEAKRYEVIMPDDTESVAMYRSALKADEDDFEEQVGEASLMLGKAYIEGAGNIYDPRRGYSLIMRAAVKNRNKEAAKFLLANAESASAYGVNIPLVAALIKRGHLDKNPKQPLSPENQLPPKQ
ncbi:MAG: sel1 repeat family protein [Clostridia bacterium]|nr:sel1 repeat family protein [Clostridia bacterium]